MDGGDRVVPVGEGGPGQDQEGQGGRRDGEDKPAPDPGPKKPSIVDYLNKGTLRLLEYLVTEKDEQIYSISDLAEELGVAPSTVSRAYRKLLEVGFLVESEYPRGNTGRPIKVIEVDYDNEMVNVIAKWIVSFNTYLRSLEITD